MGRLNQNPNAEGISSGNGPFLFISHASKDNERLAPILDALLEAGLPLWFDKPSQLGRSYNDFHGYIQPGTAWTETLIGEMRQASAMLYFPSFAYSQSHECDFEYAQAMVHRSATGGSFGIIPLLLDDASFKYLDPRTSGIQGIEAFVEERSGSWNISPKNKIDVDNLIVNLKQRLASPIPSAPKDAARSTRKDSSIPFRVDRSVPRDRVREAYRKVIDNCHSDLRQAEGGVQRPVIICHGHESDEHKFFTSTTLLDVLINRAPQYFKSGSMTSEPLRPRLPISEQKTRPEEFARIYLDNVIEKFQAAGRARTRDLMSELAEAFYDDDTTRIVASRLDVGSAKGNKPQDLLRRIEGWVRFWDTFPFSKADCEQHFLVIPVLEVVYDRPRKPGLFRSKSPASALKKSLNASSAAAELSADCTQISVQILPQFDEITEATVRDWVEDDETIFSSIPRHTQTALEADLKAAIGQGKSLDMRTWSELAEPILDKHEVGK